MLMVNKLKAMVYPFQQARGLTLSSNEVARNRVGEHGWGQRMWVTQNGINSPSPTGRGREKLILPKHHHKGRIGADSATAVCTKTPTQSAQARITDGRGQKKHHMGQTPLLRTITPQNPPIYIGS